MILAAKTAESKGREQGQGHTEEDMRVSLEEEMCVGVDGGVEMCADVEGEQMCIFSGGTGFNQASSVLKDVCPNVHYILPISDDGGSTAEIIRNLGGPSIGDIRSRLLNLASDSTEECRRVKALLQHRLTLESERAAKAEWNEIVEGNHPLWDGISPAYKATIRRFLVVFANQVLTKGCDFQFRNGSIGNFFFTGSRIFFASLDAAIFWFSRVAHIPSTSSVLPSIAGT